MTTKTITIGAATVVVSDDGAPSVRVTVPQDNGPDLSNWDTVPEWGGMVAQLTETQIGEHPTVVRLLSARPRA